MCGSRVRKNKYVKRDKTTSTEECCVNSLVQAGSFGFNSFEREASPVDYFNSTKFHPRMDVLSLDHRDDELSFHYDQANINSNMSSVPYSPLTRISSG